MVAASSNSLHLCAGRRRGGAVRGGDAGQGRQRDAAHGALATGRACWQGGPLARRALAAHPAARAPPGVRCPSRAPFRRNWLPLTAPLLTAVYRLPLPATSCWTLQQAAAGDSDLSQQARDTSAQLCHASGNRFPFANPAGCVRGPERQRAAARQRAGAGAARRTVGHHQLGAHTCAAARLCRLTLHLPVRLQQSCLPRV